MFGLTIIRKSVLRKMRNQIKWQESALERSETEISNLESVKRSLLGKLAKFDRQRKNGKFVKSTI